MFSIGDVKCPICDGDGNIITRNDDDEVIDDQLCPVCEGNGWFDTEKELRAAMERYENE